MRGNNKRIILRVKFGRGIFIKKILFIFSLGFFIFFQNLYLLHSLIFIFLTIAFLRRIFLGYP